MPEAISITQKTVETEHWLATVSIEVPPDGSPVFASLQFVVRSKEDGAYTGAASGDRINIGMEELAADLIVGNPWGLPTFAALFGGIQAYAHTKRKARTQ